ncbi:protein of unassigned function [Methylobacterium oryzae CBMB20]|uniref:Protein of unassigned function n=1 Tax=Methylobacterium oryzae CBMB20 TaxID=693986 RepID=A0A089NK65_9HYPH|nr:protein of unassigned function [Methylobacterium oryzae CBMB20]
MSEPVQRRAVRQGVGSKLCRAILGAAARGRPMPIHLPSIRI